MTEDLLNLEINIFSQLRHCTHIERNVFFYKLCSFVHGELKIKYKIDKFKFLILLKVIFKINKKKKNSEQSITLNTNKKQWK